MVCYVRDNAADITKTIKILKWTHHPGLTHTINLVLSDALKGMKSTVDKVRESAIATEKLKSPHLMGMPELGSKQQVVTGGIQLKQVLESKDAIISIFACINAAVDAPSQEE